MLCTIISCINVITRICFCVVHIIKVEIKSVLISNTCLAGIDSLRTTKTDKGFLCWSWILGHDIHSAECQY